MAAETTVIGLEMLVAELSTAVTYFVDVLGFDLAFRGPSREVPGETAVLDGGSVAVTLLDPATTGEGVLADRSPRITQLVFGAPGEGVSDLVDRMHEAGIATRVAAEGRHFVAPEVAAGVLGFEVALMFSPLAT